MLRLTIPKPIPAKLDIRATFGIVRCAARSLHPTQHTIRRHYTVVSKSKKFSNHTAVMRPQNCTSIQKPINPVVHDLFDVATGSWQYVVADPTSSRSVIIDPVLNFDPVTAKIWTESADRILAFVEANGYKVDMILETHVHADHITAASYLQHVLQQKQGLKIPICIGSRIKGIQKRFGEKYNIPLDEYRNAFDKEWEDDEIFNVGTLSAQAIHLPGHTPDHMGYKIGEDVFVGDTVFHMDIGSARADFPGGCAQSIYDSGHKLFALPDHTRIWSGHDYPPKERDGPRACSTVKQQKEGNKHLRIGTSKESFVQQRQERDETLAAPRLIHQSLQMNIRAGRLPGETNLGGRMLAIPLKSDVYW
ncbi:unnamed protein product [Periconia digitata]|uniref:Metallo-beta-lactamase domain-containing protein n=1 Tax=Periconia digitata TaxID=1303443 RepID=A0A9W4ULZ4_9PLEO|nr:unnamed protein product [Periconia digitata]